MVKAKSGYAYMYDGRGKGWRACSDEGWDIVCITPGDDWTHVGQRMIDGSRCNVFRSEAGSFFAQMTVSTGEV